MGIIKINKNKTLGSVIYILEGQQTEFYLFKKIFENIFNASENIVVCRNENTDFLEYYTIKNKNSKIFLINSSSSSIYAVNDEKYLQKIFNKIVKEFNIDYRNSYVYYIWDRDRNSNSKTVIKDYFNKFYNSLDTGYDMHGLLLLSYPCIESFIISLYEEKQIKEAIDIKKYVNTNKYSIKHIDEEKFKLAIENFLKHYKKIIDNEFKVEIIDNDMININNKIFDFEELYYINNNFYYYFSTLIISMIDLGIIEINNQ